MTSATDATREALAAAEPDTFMTSRPMCGAQVAVEGVLRRLGLPADPDAVATLALYTVGGWLVGGGAEPGATDAVFEALARAVRAGERMN
jgi:hypothetical protein